jgi:predicted ribosome quality control (RQC) complex YloA/Tae2 family protein
MNYTLILVQRLSNTLAEKLFGFYVDEVFSSGRDELYINFKQNDQYFGIKFIWAARSCFMFFEEGAYRKPVPYLIQFSALAGKEIINIQQHKNNRSFQFTFLDNTVLVIKLYNGLMYHNQTLVSHFRTSIENDSQLLLSDFDKEAPFTSSAKNNELENATDLFEAFNTYNRNTLSVFAFEEQQRKLLKQKLSEVKRLEQLIAKSEMALKQIEEAISPEEIGHIIMANLHDIKPNESEVELYDFYRDKPILVKLKKNNNAQQNAEYYYNKAKNRKAEKEQLAERITEAKEKLEPLYMVLNKIEQAETLRGLKGLTLTNTKNIKEKQELFKTFELEDFHIWVGKSAANNDLLTMKHAHKNDLWLHAKDVSGSHVIIKHQAGKTFTKSVIEYAASIAAYYSKLKGSGLVPVTYTERKFVRKPKGANPGAVVIDKEEVILVKPHI